MNVSHHPAERTQQTRSSSGVLIHNRRPGELLLRSRVRGARCQVTRLQLQLIATGVAKDDKQIFVIVPLNFQYVMDLLKFSLRPDRNE